MEEETKVQSYYLQNTRFSRIALAQVYEILMGYEDGIDNVPDRIIRFLEDNMDKDYDFDYGDDLESFKLEKDTEDLLIYIYTKYLATEEERATIEQLAEMQRAKKEKEKEEKYSADVFGTNNEINTNNLPVEYKESIIKKIINFFKNMFKK